MVRSVWQTHLRFHGPHRAGNRWAWGFGLAPVAMEVILVKAKSLINVTFGATGEVYEKGKEYDVPEETFLKYSSDFKKMETKPKNKSKKTEENK
jgi:hypothetical protein